MHAFPNKRNSWSVQVSKPQINVRGLRYGWLVPAPDPSQTPLCVLALSPAAVIGLKVTRGGRESGFLSPLPAPRTS